MKALHENRIKKVNDSIEYVKTCSTLFIFFYYSVYMVQESKACRSQQCRGMKSCICKICGVKSITIIVIIVLYKAAFVKKMLLLLLRF